MKILIVDDNDDGRLILEKTLSAAGHQVQAAENGKTALVMARKSMPELIVSDIMMPEMDGFQFCREIRTDDAFKDTPFVFYTATYTDAKDEQLAMDLGADRFIRKPMDGDTFLAQIGNVTRKVDPGEIQPSQPESEKEAGFLKQYNARLVNKLEKKILDLEAETAARKETETRLAATLKAIPDMVFRLDSQGRFLDFKPAPDFSPLMPPDRFLGRTAAEILPADIARHTLENIQKALNGERGVHYEYQMPDEGSLHDYEARYEATGKDQVVAIVRDVTVERSALRSLAASEMRYRALVESSADHIFMLDPEGTFLTSNQGCASCGMKGADIIIGKTIHSRHSPDVAKEYMDHLNTVVTSGNSVSFEHRMDTRNGIRWHLDTLYPIVQGGAVLFVGGICRDISERKAAESNLIASEAKYRGLFENSPDAVALIAVEGKILDANAAFIHIFGYDKKEILNLNVSQLYVDPDDRNTLLAEVRTQGFARNLEMRQQRKDGSQMDCLISSVGQRDTEGKLLALQIIIRDVTEVRNLQKQLLQAQKMESIGLLAGGVAHDFNNMLSIILGYSELALDRVSPSDPLASNLEEIINAAVRSTDMVRQLLAFARQQPVSPRVLDLNHLIDNSLKMLGRLIGEDIELTFVPGEALWPIEIDPSQIDQIMANLAVNARDAIGGTGRLIVETGNAEFDDDDCRIHIGSKPGKFVFLTVSDTGAGMSQETLERLFEPFYTTKGPGSGTGLGLATVYGIVQQNNGFITVYSELNYGTRFSLYFPRHEGSVEAAHMPETPICANGSETILLVEDEPMILKLCRSILKNKGYQVLCAPSPGEALVICEKHDGPIDLLMTDVVMPNMNGKELAERITAMRPDVRVLFMSGYTAQVVLHRGVLAEGSHFLQKPFSNRDLANMVRQTLDHQRS